MGSPLADRRLLQEDLAWTLEGQAEATNCEKFGPSLRPTFGHLQEGLAWSLAQRAKTAIYWQFGQSLQPTFGFSAGKAGLAA